ncbi:hypothetical protein GCM10009785_03130 [Brooklawnia cerclae]
MIRKVSAGVAGADASGPVVNEGDAVALGVTGSFGVVLPVEEDGLVAALEDEIEDGATGVSDGVSPGSEQPARASMTTLALVTRWRVFISQR